MASLQPFEGLSSEELRRLAGWIEVKRAEINYAPDVIERNAFWSRVARTLGTDALGLLLTSKELNEERDSLTGILNRRGLEWTLVEALDWQDRTRQPVTVVLMELDGFKAFNENHGRAAAGAVIGEWIGFLRARVRKTDVLGRLSGQEVVAILRGARGDQGADMFDRTRGDMAAALTKCLEALGIDRSVTVSAGVVEHEPGEHWVDLLQRGRERTSLARVAGRNLVVGGKSQ